MAPRYPRDMRGHGPTPPHPRWPGGAKVAVQFVLNYEEGGENSILHGDAGSEAFLSEIVGAQAWPGQRHWNMESIYEYGARAGFWRLHRLFAEFGMPVTLYVTSYHVEKATPVFGVLISYLLWKSTEERVDLDQIASLYSEQERGNAQFINTFRAEFRVVYLNEDYTQTVIGRSKRDYVWIMARSPRIPAEDLQHMVALLREQGYDVDAIQTVPQRWP